VGAADNWVGGVIKKMHSDYLQVGRGCIREILNDANNNYIF